MTAPCRDIISPVCCSYFQDYSRSELASVSVLATVQKRRRDFVRRLGPCRSGCDDLDKHVLMGGFERGSIVGISAEDEDGVGVPLGLQVLVCSLLDGAVEKVQIVTPKPPSTIVVLLKNSIAAELRARGVTALDKAAAQERDCMNRIMLSRVFDMDGLFEVLTDLADAAAYEVGEHTLDKPEVGDVQPVEATRTKTQIAAATATVGVKNESQGSSAAAEIQDSQDEDTALSPSQIVALDEGQRNEVTHSDKKSTTDTSGTAHIAAAFTSRSSPAANPNIILITHFSSLLTSFFTQRDNSAAHTTLRLLASRLRLFSRALLSSPLILLINSTDSSAVFTAPAAYSPEPQSYSIPPSEQPATHKPYIDPTLRSIFNPASPSLGHASGYKSNKPTFGLIFTQLLDVHLLCTRAPRPGKTPLSSALTVVEVLLDDIGLWEGEGGFRRRREQRWTVVAPHNDRIVDASDSKTLIGNYEATA